VTLLLPEMEDQISLALSWLSVSWCSRELAAICFAFKGSKYTIYECLVPFTTEITKDAKPKVFDTPLTLIFMMVLGASYYPFDLQRQPVLHWRQMATIHNADYEWCTTNNRWHLFHSIVYSKSAHSNTSGHMFFSLLVAVETYLGRAPWWSSVQ
jgi:hypothetical protein